MYSEEDPMIVVTRGQIPIESTVASLRQPDCGAVISYLGTVRSYLEGKTCLGLSFEVDDSTMTEELQAIEAIALERFDISEIAIVHRAGYFEVGDDILLIAISAGHRGPAFEACLWTIDRIKDLHDLWKREDFAS